MGGTASGGVNLCTGQKIETFGCVKNPRLILAEKIKKYNNSVRSERGGFMTRYEELAASLDGIEAGKKGFILSLLSDFVFIEEQIEKLREYPRYVINPVNPKQQKKLPVHDMLKDYQAQKNDIAVKILRTIGGDAGEESPLLKALARFE